MYFAIIFLSHGGNTNTFVTKSRKAKPIRKMIYHKASKKYIDLIHGRPQGMARGALAPPPGRARPKIVCF